jgi:chorismate mutase/prephenate dehydratase
VGALYRILKPFSDREINLTKIESRPVKKKLWEYVFYVDLLGHATEPRVREALTLLKEECVFLKILGSYPQARPSTEG